MHLRGDRRPQELCRGRLRLREAQLGEREEGHGGRIPPGSLLIHDFERAHGALVREGGLESEAHRADVNDPVYLEWIEIVNDLCSWLKRHRRISTGTSTSSGSARRATDKTRPQGCCALS